MANSMQALASSHEELLMKYVLASAEIERLVISNAMAKRETEQWKHKYKECELLIKRKSSLESVRSAGYIVNDLFYEGNGRE